VNIEVPFVGESIENMRVLRWLKADGDHVTAEEPLLEITTEKIDFIIEAPASGTLVDVSAAEGASVTPNQIIAAIDPD
jgi:2-oxoglutarate dehydrogenase E2 component (dihydrolipoamide succinyltransferase)